MTQTPPTSPPSTPASKRSAGAQMTMGAIIISAFLFAGKAAGYVKDMVISGYFGGTAVSDAFYLNYNNIIFLLYARIEKLLRPTFLPQFVRQMKDSEQNAWRLFSVIANTHVLTMLLIVTLIEVFAGRIISTLWPNLAADPGHFRLAVAVLRIMAPALVLYSPSVMLELALHSYKQFTIPALADCLSRIGLLVALFVGVEFLWHPDNPNAIYAAAFGVLVAYPLRLLVQLPSLWSRLKGYALTLDMSTPGAKTVFALMPPVIVGLIFSSARGLADSIYADRIGEGIYTCLTFARKMTDAPLQILPLAVSFVVFPFLSQWAAEGAKDRLADALVSMTRAMAFLFVPATVALMVLSKVIISLMFEHGRVGPESTQLAAIALFCYALGMLAYSVEGSINHWYFALEDTRTPNYIGAAMAVLHILIGYLGVFIIAHGTVADTITNLGAVQVGIAAIALALTISKTVKVVILYGLLLKHIGTIDKRRVYRFVAQVAFSTIVMAAVMWIALTVVHDPILAWTPPVGGKKMQMLLLLAIVGGGGTVAYVAAAAAVRIEELSTVWGHLTRKVRKRLER